MELSTYPDDIKYINWKVFNGWHYITQAWVPKEIKNKLSEIKNSELRPGDDNIVWAINEMKRTLRNTNSSAVDDHFAKSFALIWLIHLVGDIHQPLHAISRIDPKTLKQDSGGNNFTVKINKKTLIPLHTIWDENLRQYGALESPLKPEQKKRLDEDVKNLMNEFP